MTQLLDRIIVGIELLVAVILVALAALGLALVAVSAFDLVARGWNVSATSIIRVLDAVLIVFIVVELFKIAIAYMEHRNVMPTVLEAAFVAVARKLVVYEGGEETLVKAGAMAILMLSIAASWWLLKRSGAVETQ